MERQLPPRFSPGHHDVILGRGKKPLSHTGNIRMKSIVQSYLPRYEEATSQSQKSAVVSEVVSRILADSPSGGFVRQKGGVWFEVGDHAAREKVSQTFRDFLHHRYRSSLHNKKKVQKEKRRSRESVVRAEMVPPKEVALLQKKHKPASGQPSRESRRSTTGSFDLRRTGSEEERGDTKPYYQYVCETTPEKLLMYREIIARVHFQADERVTGSTSPPHSVGSVSA